MIKRRQVRRDDHHVETAFNALPCECTDDVVGLVSGNREDRNAIRLQEIANALHAAIEVVLQILG